MNAIREPSEPMGGDVETHIKIYSGEKYILKRKCILLVEVLKLDFRVLCQPTKMPCIKIYF